VMPGRLRQATDTVPDSLQPKAVSVATQRPQSEAQKFRPAFQSHWHAERQAQREIEKEVLGDVGTASKPSSALASAERLARASSSIPAHGLGQAQRKRKGLDRSQSTAQPPQSCSAGDGAEDGPKDDDDGDDISWASGSDLEEDLFVPEPNGGAKKITPATLELRSARMAMSTNPAQRHWGQALQHVEKVAAARRMKMQAELAMNNMRTLKLFIRGRTAVSHMEKDLERQVNHMSLGTYQHLVREIESKHISPPARYNRMLEEKIVPVIHGLQKELIPVSNTAGPARIVARELEEEEELGGKSLTWIAERRATMVSVHDEYNGLIHQASSRLSKAVAQASSSIKEKNKFIEELSQEKTRLRTAHEQYVNEMLELDRREKFILGVVQQVEDDEKRIEAEKQAKIRQLSDELFSLSRLMTNLERLCQDEQHKARSTRSKLERKLEEKMLANANRMIDLRLQRQLRERIHSQRKLMHQYVVICHKILRTEAVLAARKAQLEDRQVVAQMFHLRFLTIEAKALAMEMRQRVSELDVDGTVRHATAEDDEEADPVKNQAAKHGVLKFLGKELDVQMAWLRERGQTAEACQNTLSITETSDPLLPPSMQTILEEVLEENAENTWEVVDLRLSRRRRSSAASRRSSLGLPDAGLPGHHALEAEQAGRYRPQLNVQQALDGREKASHAEDAAQRAKPPLLSTGRAKIDDEGILSSCRDLANLQELKAEIETFKERWETWVQKVGFGSVRQGPVITERINALLDDLGEALKLAESAYYWFSQGAKASGCFNDLLEAPGEIDWLPRLATRLHQRLGVLITAEQHLEASRKEHGRTGFEKAVMPVMVLLLGLDALMRKTLRRQAEAWQLRVHSALREQIEHYSSATASLRWFRNARSEKEALTAINRGLLHAYRALRVPVMRDGASEKRLMLPELDREVWHPLEVSMKTRDPEALEGSHLVLGMLLMSTRVVDIGGIPLQEAPKAKFPMAKEHYTQEELEELLKKHSAFGGGPPEEWDSFASMSPTPTGGSLSPKTPRRRFLRDSPLNEKDQFAVDDALKEAVCRTPGIMTWWRSLLPEARPPSVEESESSEEGMQGVDTDKAIDGPSPQDEQQEAAAGELGGTVILDPVQEEDLSASASMQEVAAPVEEEEDTLSTTKSGRLQVKSPTTPSEGRGGGSRNSSRPMSRSMSRKTASRLQSSTSPTPMSRASSAKSSSGRKSSQSGQDMAMGRRATASDIDSKRRSLGVRYRNMRPMNSEPRLPSQSRRSSSRGSRQESPEPEAEAAITSQVLEADAAEEEPEAEHAVSDRPMSGRANSARARSRSDGKEQGSSRGASPAQESTSSARGRRSQGSSGRGSAVEEESLSRELRDQELSGELLDDESWMRQKATSRTDRSSPHSERVSPESRRNVLDFQGGPGSLAGRHRGGLDAAKNRLQKLKIARKFGGARDRSPQSPDSAGSPQEDNFLFVGNGQGEEVREWLEKAKSTRFTGIVAAASARRQRSPASKEASISTMLELEDSREDDTGEAVLNKSLASVVVESREGQLFQPSSPRNFQAETLTQEVPKARQPKPRIFAHEMLQQSRPPVRRGKQMDPAHRFGLEGKQLPVAEPNFPHADKWKRATRLPSKFVEEDDDDDMESPTSPSEVVQDWRELLHQTRPFLMQDAVKESAEPEPSESVPSRPASRPTSRPASRQEQPRASLEIDAAQQPVEAQLAEDLLQMLHPKMRETSEAAGSMLTLSAMQLQDMMDVSRRLGLDPSVVQQQTADTPKDPAPKPEIPPSEDDGADAQPPPATTTANFLLPALYRSAPRTVLSARLFEAADGAPVANHFFSQAAAADLLRAEAQNKPRQLLLTPDGLREAKLPTSVGALPHPSASSTRSLCLVPPRLLQELSSLIEPEPREKAVVAEKRVPPESFDDYADYVVAMQQEKRHWIPALPSPDSRPEQLPPRPLARPNTVSSATTSTQMPSRPSSRGMSHACSSRAASPPDRRQSFACGSGNQLTVSARDPAAKLREEDEAALTPPYGMVARLPGSGATRGVATPQGMIKQAALHQARATADAFRLPGLLEHEVEAAVMRPSGAVVGVPHSKCFGWKAGQSVLHNMSGTGEVLSGEKDQVQRERTPRKKQPPAAAERPSARNRPATVLKGQR